MEPIDFIGANIVGAKDQPEYQNLPAFKDIDGQVISCWKLSLREKIKVLFSGVIWSSMLTFNRPIQPQMLTTEYPFIKE